jgi:transcriptional regulator with XRE-family HTH domain
MFESVSPFYPSEQRHAVRGLLFGRSIYETRKSVGLSLEEAARLSGMEVSEWLAIEAGYAPEDVNRLRAMADAMEISFDRIAMVVLLCREAGEL